MSTVKIADLRHRVLVEEPVRTPDGGGGAIQTWSPIAEVWAAIRPLNGSERVVADTIAGRITHEIWIRWREGVGPHLRLRYGSRIFDLLSVLDVDEQHRFLRCLVEERLS